MLHFVPTSTLVLMSVSTFPQLKVASMVKRSTYRLLNLWMLQVIGRAKNQKFLLLNLLVTRLFSLYSYPFMTFQLVICCEHLYTRNHIFQTIFTTQYHSKKVSLIGYIVYFKIGFLQPS